MNGLALISLVFRKETIRMFPNLDLLEGQSHNPKGNLSPRD